MPITSNTPIVQESQTVTYNTWWLVSLLVQSQTPNVATTAEGLFRLANINDDGQVTFYIDENGRTVDRVLSIPDLFGLGGNDPAVGALIDSVVTTIGQLAMSAGVIE